MEHENNDKGDGENVRDGDEIDDDESLDSFCSGRWQIFEILFSKKKTLK